MVNITVDRVCKVYINRMSSISKIQHGVNIRAVNIIKCTISKIQMAIKCEVEYSRIRSEVEVKMRENTTLVIATATPIYIKQTPKNSSAVAHKINIPTNKKKKRLHIIGIFFLFFQISPINIFIFQNRNLMYALPSASCSKKYLFDVLFSPFIANVKLLKLPSELETPK
jgi:hypothetical protein